MVCLNIYYLSLFVVDLPMRLVSTPGVSITEAIPSRILNYLRSLVVPRCLSTIATRSPTRQLNRLLFPQLGSPTNDTLNFLIQSLRFVFHGFFQSFNSSLMFLFVIIFSICSGECKISCEFFALLEKEKIGLPVLNKVLNINAIEKDLSCLSIVYIIVINKYEA